MISKKPRTEEDTEAVEVVRNERRFVLDDPLRLAERIRWPDGPVCPYCGERERMVPEPSEGRLRYECVACGNHSGHIRRPGAPNEAPAGAPARRTIAPRFPPGQ